MPRFANAEKTRKRNTDLIQKLQRLLNASINSHSNLQQENRLLQQEFQLLKSFCDGLGVLSAWQHPCAPTPLQPLVTQLVHADMLHTLHGRERSCPPCIHAITVPR